MRIRRIAILIDGGFFLKRLSRLVEPRYCGTPKAVADSARMLCKRHVQRLIGEKPTTSRSRWLDHTYRLFYYDAMPYDGVGHNPITNVQIQYAKTDEAKFRQELFTELKAKRKFALRIGKVVKEDGWRFKDASVTKKVLRTRQCLPLLEALLDNLENGTAIPSYSDEQRQALTKIVETWQGLSDSDVKLALRQKGVDMRIGLDISTLTLKKHVDTIILVTGDSDFVPAAKLARREGVEFIIDPLWQQVNDDLHEHVDGVISAYKNPDDTTGVDDDGA